MVALQSNGKACAKTPNDNTFLKQLQIKRLQHGTGAAAQLEMPFWHTASPSVESVELPFWRIWAVDT
jgi:hypothetical protein